MQELIHELNSIHPWQLAKTLTAEEVETRLAELLDHLIRDDFSGLVRLLYRIDIEEARLRYLLQQHKGEDAGRIIARLIIDRLIRKIETRKQFSTGREDIPEEDRW